MAANDKKTEEQAEGIIVGPGKSGVMSIVEIETLDALSEGVIDGIVDREYVFAGTKGNIGWDSYTTKVFPDPPNAEGFGWLRSVYWNQVPIVSSNNKYNFQRVDMTRTEGYPNGPILGPVSNNFLTVTRAICASLNVSAAAEPFSNILAIAPAISEYPAICCAFVFSFKLAYFSLDSIKYL